MKPGLDKILCRDAHASDPPADLKEVSFDEHRVPSAEGQGDWPKFGHRREASQRRFTGTEF